MTQSLPLVSIVALCYNHEKFVQECLTSILNQSYPNIELIIIDDHSGDESVPVIKKWIDEHNYSCRFIEHQTNLGLAATLNEALSLIRGDYYHPLSCDDVIMPEKTLVQVETFLQSKTNYAVVYSDIFTINESSEIISDSVFHSRGWTSPEMIPSGYIFRELSKECIIPAPSAMIDSTIGKDYRYNESLEMEDWDLWLRISKEHPIKGIPDRLVKYRIHSQSMYQQRSHKYVDSMLRINKAHIGFDKEADIYLKDFIYRESILNYMHGGINNLKWLCQRFLIKPSMKNLMHVLLALFGIPYKFKAGMKELAGRSNG